MITVVCTTNRPSSMTLKISSVYAEMLRAKGVDVQVFSMEQLPADFLSEDYFGKITPALNELVDKYIAKAEKLVFVSPEYNGSYPGIFKAFVDAGENNKFFAGKKAALVGIATGRAGNLRGLDHLTDIFHHMALEVLSFKVPISRVHHEMDAEGKLLNAPTIKVLEKQIDLLLKF